MLLHLVILSALGLLAYAIYKYKTLAGIEAELKTLTAAGETDAAKVIAAIKAKL